MKNLQNYINFLEWKDVEVKYIFSPRIDNALVNWIHLFLRCKKISHHDYEYHNPEHKKVSELCWKKAEEIMTSMESIIEFLSSEKINPRNFKGFWNKSYQEFLNKLNSLS